MFWLFSLFVMNRSDQALKASDPANTILLISWVKAFKEANNGKAPTKADMPFYLCKEFVSVTCGFPVNA